MAIKVPITAVTLMVNPRAKFRANSPYGPTFGNTIILNKN